jgi:hydroperoxide dehydratase
LPLKAIPGEYGGTLGAIKDRLDFFWFQGLREFFTSRVQKYQSTVFRVNMPPGPPGFPDPRVILLLDAKSYPVLFDVNKVLKKDVFTGTYHPSWDYTGGVCMLAYLDPSKERHTKLKTFVFEIFKTNGRPQVLTRVSQGHLQERPGMGVESCQGLKAGFTYENLQFTFNFQMRAIVGRNPIAPRLASLGFCSKVLRGHRRTPWVVRIF